LRRLVLPLAVLAGLAIAAPAAAQSRPTFVTGIGDQQPEMFTHPLFQALQVKRSRLIVSYDVATPKGDADEAARVERWIRNAQSQRVEILVSFNHRRRDTCLQSRLSNRCYLPPVREYMQAFRAFRAKYPLIRLYSPWNEANHNSQPTLKNPKRVAEYYNAVRKSCTRCTLVALDVLDGREPGPTVRYIRGFVRHAKKPRIFGLHNYSDTNRNSDKRTRAILKALPRGTQLWLTETGGVVKFGAGFPYSPARAAQATRKMFSIARTHKRIKRLYIYQWTGADRDARFDAGLMDADGKPRPAYAVVRNELERQRRALRRR
jgi:hypothetical protein